ncbi:enoyl-CoA hydratase [Castellaniella sp.]|uniref:enoyl-CoA hydratase n=1 Tax=Castellaniella sp. TaxID=1955812 RepID=UPI003561F611
MGHSSPHATHPAPSAQEGTVTAVQEGGILRITLSNPARHNAMSSAMWRQLQVLVQAASQNDQLRVLAISGAGEKAFCSGADISEFAGQEDEQRWMAAFNQAIFDAQQALIECPHPSVALIRGICMGGGMGLALACDLRYCAAESRFRMPAGRMGLGYDHRGLARFVDVLGLARASELFFTSQLVDGERAEQVGLVQGVFPDARFLSSAEDLLAAIATSAPLTLRAAKLGLRRALGQPGGPTEAQAHEAMARCFLSKDYQEGQRAFREKRAPRFEGT